MSVTEANALALAAVLEHLQGLPERPVRQARFGRLDCPACGLHRGLRWGKGRLGLTFKCDAGRCADYKGSEKGDESC